MNEAKTEAKTLRKGDMGEEDVDIGDEEMMPVGGFPPVEIENDAAAHASSSRSDSSSSSDSDDSSSSSGMTIVVRIVSLNHGKASCG